MKGSLIYFFKGMDCVALYTADGMVDSEVLSSASIVQGGPGREYTQSRKREQLLEEDPIPSNLYLGRLDTDCNSSYFL